MKKTILIPVLIFLFILGFTFFCVNEDIIDGMNVADASGRYYLVEYHLIFNQVTYFEDSGVSNASERNIKWDRIFVIAVAVG